MPPPPPWKFAALWPVRKYGPDRNKLKANVGPVILIYYEARSKNIMLNKTLFADSQARSIHPPAFLLRIYYKILYFNGCV
jgi:hypothetical protein